jgi:hypothetical protein
MRAPYAPFDPANTDQIHSPPVSPPRVAGAGAAVLESCPLAAEALAGALGLSPVNWEAEAASLTRDEVDRRLRAADMGGLVDAVWHGLCTAQERPRTHTPVLGQTVIPRSASTPTMAQSPIVREPTDQDGVSSLARHVPSVPIMHGRVPRSQESWQYHEAEWPSLGCMRAVCMRAQHATAACASPHTPQRQ